MAVLDARPPPGLSPPPRAHSRGRAPPPSRATLNCASFAGSCGDGGTYVSALLFVLFLFASLLPRRRNIEVLLYVFKFAPGIFRAAATLRSRIVAELRYLPTSRAPVAIALSRLPSFAGHPRPLRPSPLPCFGTRLPGRIRIRLLLCTSSGSIFEKKTWGFICLLAAKFNQIIQQSTYGQEKKKSTARTRAVR